MTMLRWTLGVLLCVGLLATPAFAESDAGTGVPADATATTDGGSTDGGSTDAGTGDAVGTPDSSTPTGDGGPKPSANSCVARCGSYNSSAACQCDADCSKPENNDCCADIASICTDGACGNGKCEAGESGANCVVDCVKCGDAVCEDAEKDSCPADCDPSYNGNPCYDEKCKEPISKCTGDEKCKKFVACAKSGKKSEDCAAELGLSQADGEAINGLLKAISDCGKENCSVAGSDTCKDRCGTEYSENFVCQCDSECTQYNDCCPDYTELCDGGGSCTPACDGKQCGPDGCGGNCGSCPAGSTCNAGAGKCESGGGGGGADATNGDSTGGGGATDATGTDGTGTGTDGTGTTGGTGGTGGTTTPTNASSSSSSCTAAPTSNGASGLLLVLGLVFGLVAFRRRFA